MPKDYKNRLKIGGNMDKIFNEIKKEIDFSFPQQTVFSKGDFLEIKKTGKDLNVQYCEGADILRAALIVKTNEELENYTITEKKQFEDVIFFVDCSRNAVINVETIKKLMRIAAMVGYNAFMIYTEDTYEVIDEPVFGYLRGRYSIAEMKEIDAYGKEIGMEVIPQIQVLAHLNSLKRWYKEYQDHFDCEDILLVGDERIYTLIDNMFKTLAQCYSTRRVHIGMDEAHLVGRGEYLDLNGYQPSYEILLKHLQRVSEIGEKYGFSLMMWGDMFLKLAAKINQTKNVSNIYTIPQEVKEKIPKNVSICHWQYGIPINEEGVRVYEKLFEAFEGATQKVGYAAASFKWNGFVPCNNYSMTAHNLGVKMAKKYNMSYIINTTWGDNGAEASPFAILPAMATFAMKTRDGDIESVKKEFLVLTGYTLEDYLKLDWANNCCGKYLDYANINKYHLFNDVFSGMFDCYVTEEEKESFAIVEQALAAMKKGKYQYVFDTVECLCRVLVNKYDIGVRLRKAYQANDRTTMFEIVDTLGVIVEDIAKLLDTFRVQWMTDNKTYGFDVQEYRIGGLKERVSSCRNRLKAYLDGEIASIPELEIELLDRVFQGEHPITGRLNWNDFTMTISSNNI